jgi:thioredoxin 1
VLPCNKNGNAVTGIFSTITNEGEFTTAAEKQIVKAMSPPKPYLCETEAPARAEADALPNLTLLEFGTSWCGYCRAAQPALVEVLSQHSQWRHVKVEDGPGRALGRSYHVKLWPTLVLLRDGQEVARLVRPTQAADISAALNIV